MQGEACGKMGAGVGGVPAPGSAGGALDGAPHGLGDPRCRHPLSGGPGGASFALSPDTERSLCGFSPWVFCSKWIPGTPPGCPDPESTAGHSSRPPLRALNKFALSPESRDCTLIAATADGTQSVAQHDGLTPGPWAVHLDRVPRGWAVSPEAAGEPVSWPLIS